MEIVEIDGKKYIRRVSYIDHGKAGVTTVEVLDPCISKESQRLREAEIRQACRRIMSR